MKAQRLLLPAILSCLAAAQPSCYSFRGTSISPNISTYYVNNFQNNADNAPAGISIDFSEALKEKIRTQSRLTLADTDPDIEFRGTIVDYRISAEAPQPDERTALNRLTIITAVEYINHREEGKNWKSNFSFFYDFPSSQDFTSVREVATLTIANQIMEDIFNKSFNDW